LGRILADPSGRRFVLALTDQVVRMRDQRRAAARLRDLVGRRGPAFAGPIDRALLLAGAAASHVAPALVVDLVVRRLRAETGGVVLPAEDPQLAQHLARRRADGFASNVNVLGEAILGDGEARRRFELVRTALRRPDVDRLSVKVSSLCSQLGPIDFAGNLARVGERLATLYTEAVEHGVFVTLDMEEHRDLELTVAAFRAVLEHAPGLDAGIALQAYLPDSHAVAESLCEWALERHERGGGTIKVRLVKGANLAMERVEAELRGWPQAPYPTKDEVDASFKRLLDTLLDDRWAPAVRVGVASHNLFDLAWASTLDAGGRVDLEMLEGMAQPEARAVRQRAGTVVLYTPVVTRAEYHAAIAYLARRLDENTAPENFLHALFTLTPDSPAFATERERFRRAVEARATVDTTSRRAARELRPTRPDAPFVNEPDTDWTVPANRTRLADAMASAQLPGARVATPALGIEEVDHAVAVARASGWPSTSMAERRTVLCRVADVMAATRFETLAVMAHTAAKTALEGDPEVSEAIDFARYYAASTRTIEALLADGLTFEPLGPVVVIPPWNFPYSIPAGGVLAALAAGNPVILKPAPETLAVGELVARHCWEAGVPADALQLLPVGEDDAGQRLVTHPDVGGVILTGSYETAQLFRSWRPDLRLHAETSGKNAIVVTAAADLDLAVKDLVQSAFGHAGQKCSAASLAILEASVYDDEAFRQQLADAVTTLRVGDAHEPSTVMGPLIRPAEGPLARALTALDPGESWLVEPRQLAERTWTPGVKLGVTPGSWFHQTECFGPVLGLMRAPDLDTAVTWQNTTPFGLTGGIHSLDEREVERWLASVDVGNAYVNRGITGAIVQRQPFGGRKRSVVGPTAKAGGPNYVLTLGTWRGPLDRDLDRWWRDEFGVARDATGLRAERNALRYQPRDEVVALVGGSDEERRVARAAAALAGVEVRDQVGPGVGRVRLLGEVDEATRRSWLDAGIDLDPSPVVGHGRIELLRWVREQAVTETRHRLGNLLDPVASAG
jgi:RHH-type proline utilization regulon transcriptional repressor/proline dehydrogenase/delta 1-pyrroline-5-carboxylate dehydrogenase